MRTIIFTYEGFEYTNIGDYIQSLAAKQFVNNEKDIIYVHRDKLSEYTGEKAKVIMNGWFTHISANWPPAPAIKPLFVSFHINYEAYQSLLSLKSIEYLKQYEPIGCRDIDTALKLQGKNVQAYFSSCLTTTLGYKYKSSNSNDKIYIVDPVHYVPEMSYRFKKYKLLVDYITHIFGIRKYIKNIKENNIYDLKFNVKNLNRYAAIIRSYIIVKQILNKDELDKAVVLTQYHYDYEYPTNESRFERAEELIRMYSEARLVITSRIHCALPCLGLETPVIFLKNADDTPESTCRFKGLLNLLNIITFKKNKIIDSCIKTPMSAVKIKNKNDYKRYSLDLIDQCTKFYK